LHSCPAPQPAAGHVAPIGVGHGGAKDRGRRGASLALHVSPSEQSASLEQGTAAPDASFERPQALVAYAISSAPNQARISLQACEKLAALAGLLRAALSPAFPTEDKPGWHTLGQPSDRPAVLDGA
jgi:hypothetical protein